MLLFLLAACLRHEPPPASLSAGDAEIIGHFQDLHRSVYRVYELGEDRDAIHDLLAGSFTGEALTSEYIEHYSTLAHMADEETSIQVKRVDYELVTVLERGPDFVRVDADWSVGGIVTHQRHKHPRVNRYRAVYTLRDADGELRITSTRMRNLQRVRSVLSGSPDEFLLDTLPSSGGGFMDPLDFLDAELMKSPDEPENDPEKEGAE